MKLILAWELRRLLLEAVGARRGLKIFLYIEKFLYISLLTLELTTSSGLSLSIVFSSFFFQAHIPIVFITSLGDGEPSSENCGFLGKTYQALVNQVFNCLVTKYQYQT